MNGRVYDPMIGRFTSADPMTESPFSSQGWNRYSYVGNSPVNFTDPSGYCFLGCFWNKIWKAVGRLLAKFPILATGCEGGGDGAVRRPVRPAGQRGDLCPHRRHDRRQSRPGVASGANHGADPP